MTSNDVYERLGVLEQLLAAGDKIGAVGSSSRSDASRLLLPQRID